MTKIVGIGLAALVTLLAVIWIGQGNDFFMYRVFGLRYEDTRRDIFERSRAFNEGMAQELQRMWLDYERATDPGERSAIRSLVVHRVAGYDVERIQNPQLREFVRRMVRGENG